MRPLITYELVRIRMEQDHQAERRHLAQAEMPRVVRSSASSRAAGQRWRDSISRYAQLRAPAVQDATGDKA